MEETWGCKMRGPLGWGAAGDLQRLIENVPGGDGAEPSTPVQSPSARAISHLTQYRTVPHLGLPRDPGAGPASLPVGALGLAGRCEAALSYVASGTVVW